MGQNGFSYLCSCKTIKQFRVDNFIGNIDAKVDDKGRVCVPADFRKIILSERDARLILRKDIYEDCLVLYPLSVWEEELPMLHSKLKKYGKESRQLYRKFIQDSNSLEIDSNGRILIPKRYLQMVGIGADVRFIGIDQTIEIWAPDRLNDSTMDDATFEQLMDQLDGNE